MASTDALPADLALDPGAVRLLGYRAMDAIAARLAGLDAAPVGERTLDVLARLLQEHPR